MKGWTNNNRVILQPDQTIWDQKVYFEKLPSGADIYSYNKINPLLLIAICLLLIAVCLQFCVDYCWMSENGAGIQGVNTNVSVI